MPASPAFSTMEELRTLYDELSASPCPYFKSVVRVKLSKKAYILRSVIHTGSHADLKVESHRGAVAIELLSRHTEMTVGSLYTCQVSSAPRKMSPEWAVIFKIDCDMARKKTGSIDPALAHYISNASTRADRKEVSRLRRKLDRSGMGGRPIGPESSPVGDLLIRYGKKDDYGVWDSADFVTAWILQNQALIKAGNFMGETYREPTMVLASAGLSEVERVDEDTVRIDYGLNLVGDG